MPDVLIRNVPQDVLDELKRRAEANRRSLQQELLRVLEAAAPVPRPPSPEAVAMVDAMRKKLAESGHVFEDSTLLIRADRER